MVLLLVVADGRVAGSSEETGRPPADTSGPDREASALRSKPKSAGTGKAMVLTPEREAAALTFVRQHHAELAELLTHLKGTSPREYERALRELFRTSERLAQIQERDRTAFELELQLWKARSRAQLLSARLRISDDEAVRAELRAVLGDEYDARVRVLEHERARLGSRIQGLDEQLGALRSQRDQAIESRYEATVQHARSLDGSGRPGAGKGNPGRFPRDPSKSAPRNKSPSPDGP